ncbi:unnamed protein product [Paramecium primaurelia]|uniref:Uncharacterized protein n=1 Tax=Paramecium primaurelia TaxID=5886 RepID=A0A8S1L5A1_PARPR|nr:unnamed protein product [Paramecium primaurelia]
MSCKVIQQINVSKSNSVIQIKRYIVTQSRTARQSYIQEEKARQIDRENQMLFQKILGITMKQRNCSTTPTKSTLNYKNRKDFQQKIMDENQKLFTRIKQQTSYYKIQKSQTKSLSKQRANSSVNIKKYIKQYLPSKKLQELYQSKLEQGGLIYKIKIIIDGQLFKIMATTEEQTYTRVLEMMKSDGILLLKNVFQNDYQKLIGSLQISDKITIKGIELIENHGNFG